MRHDRLRSTAISLFLADHREALLRNLRNVESMHYNVRRKALDTEARKKFKEETNSVRDHYMNIAKQGSSGFGERRCETQAAKQVHSTDPHHGPQSSSSEMPKQTPVKRQKVAEALAVAPRNQRLSPLRTEVDSVNVDSGKEFRKNGVRRAALRGRLVNCSGCLREI